MTAPIDQTFVSGTTISSGWLNGVNDHVNSKNAFEHTSSVISVTPSTNNSATSVQTQLTNIGSTTGSKYIGHSPVGTSLTTTVENKLKEVISVKDFIPSGTNTSTENCQSYINDAINYAIANTPCRLVFPSAVYKVDSSLGPYVANDLEIDFGGSTLDFSSASISPYTPMLEFAGLYSGTPVLLTGSGAGVNSQIVNCTSTTFNIGDLVRIYSTRIWDSTRTNTRIGELNYIEAIPNSTSVVVVAPVENNYTTGYSAAIQKLTPVKNVHLFNGKFVGPSSDNQLGCIQITLGVGCSIKNIRTFSFDIYHLRLRDCIQSTIDGCYINDAGHLSQAYGISVADACQDCLITNNTITNTRHAFTTNNNISSSYGITRRITVAHNTVYNNVDNLGGGSGDALDTHAGSEDIYFYHNSVEGAYGIGINCESRSAYIHGNSINGCTSTGISFQSYCDFVQAECIISDNSIWNAGDSDYTNGSTVFIVSVDGTGSGATATVSVNSSNTVTGATVVLGGSGYTDGEKVRLISSDGLAYRLLGTVIVSAGSVTAVTLTGGTISSTDDGIRVTTTQTTAKNILVSDNKITCKDNGILVNGSITYGAHTITVGGSGYTNGETVKIALASDPNVYMFGTVTVSAGAVTALTITSGFPVFSNGNSVTITATDGTGTGATGTISVTLSAQIYNVIISNNAVTNSGTGSTAITAISLTDCEKFSVSNNTIESQTRGIVLTDCGLGSVIGNVCNINYISRTPETSSYCIYSDSTASTSITGNSLGFSGTGTPTDLRGVSVNTYSKYVGVWNNVVKSFTTSIFIDGSSTGSVQANNITAV